MLSFTPHQRDQLILWHIVQHSLSSYNKLVECFGDATSAIAASALTDWQQLKLHANHIERFQLYHRAEGEHDFEQRLQLIKQYCHSVLFKSDEEYPELLRQLDDAPPILFVVGDAALLNQPQIAMVGSRQMSAHGEQIAFDFAQFFAQAGIVVTSGLALGVDAACHRGAMQSGQTIAVIGTGLDMCYPAEHQQLWQQIVEAGGAIMSEFLPKTPPHKANFPRRNRLISGLSLGTVVVEAGIKSGSLITAKTAANQGRQVFAIPGHIYSTFHQGCHQLIREGATLIDHPQQVIEDLSTFRPLNLQPSVAHPQQFSAMPAMPRMNNSQAKPLAREQSANPKHVPAHVRHVYDALDFVGVDVDALAQRLKMPIQELNIALVELELLDLCQQHGGRYIRC